MAQVSIVIPAFNEQDGIGRVLNALSALPGAPEVVVVDDGSTDETATAARAAGAVVVRHPANAGYGASLKSGIRAASNDIIVITDADGTYPINRIPDLVETFEQGFDMVVGARQGREYQGSFLKMPARAVFKMLVEFTTGRSIPDINSGLRVFRKSTVLPHFPEICNGFSFTTTITLIYMLTGKLVTYRPIAYEKRVGRSKVKIFRDSVRTLQYIVECIVRYNPLKLFLLLCMLCVLWSLVFIPFFGPIAVFFGGLTTILAAAFGLLAEAHRTR